MGQKRFSCHGNGNGNCLPTEHLKSAQELVHHVSVHSGSNWNLAVLVFEERGKPECPEKNRESNPGHIGGRRVLSPPRHTCNPTLSFIQFGSAFFQP